MNCAICGKKINKKDLLDLSVPERFEIILIHKKCFTKEIVGKPVFLDGKIVGKVEMAE